MSKFITQNPAKSRRKEASRERKAAVWGTLPRHARRAMQTAGLRDLERKATRICDEWDPPAGKVQHVTTPVATPHSSYLDAIGVQEPTPRQIAARKAAATRKANAAKRNG